MLTTDEVIWGFRMILARSPDAKVVEEWRALPDVATLRALLLGSDEFHNLQSAGPEAVALDDLSAPRIVFQHLPKCAGSTVHTALLAAVGDPKSICLERHNGLRAMPFRELQRYRLFSGHFDAHSISVIPGEDVRVFTVLREPVARILSLYRFLRVFDLAAAEGSGRNLELARLARRLPADAFFADPHVVTHPSVDNGMVRALSGALPTRSWEAVQDETFAPINDWAAALDRARAHLARMVGVARVETLETDLPVIFENLGLPEPGPLARENVTPPSEAEETADSEALTALIEPLVVHDRALYEAVT